MEQDWAYCVDRLLKAWTGYQLAVRMLSGGPETYQKAEWFAKVLAEHVLNSRNQQVHNLTEWIADILDNEFDLILEDNSIEWLASSLLKCCLWLRKCQKAELENFLSQLPSESAVQTATTESQIVLDNSDEEYSSSGELEYEVQNDQTNKPSRRRTETDEDGWTTVVRR
ncbi:Pre-rRNA-processing protein TSR2 family protein [Acanthocheilonema viteae]